MNNAIKPIIAAIEQFDIAESIAHHDTLEIKLPLGIFRYRELYPNPEMEWDSIEISMKYDHKELHFSIDLEEESSTRECRIIQKQWLQDERLVIYSINGPVTLSLTDAQELVFFLMNYFRCFHCNISTKLSK